MLSIHILSAPDYAACENGTIIGPRGKPLKPNHDGRGYLCVTVRSASGKRTTRKIHHLVMEAFNGPTPAGHHIDHIDHNKLNNAINNLRWRRARENSADCAKTSRKGARCVTPQAIAAMKALEGLWWNKADISRALGIPEPTIRRHLKNSS